MSNFVFSNKTTVYFGVEKMRYLPHVVSGYGKRVMIVTGGSSGTNGALKDVTELLDSFEVTVFDNVSPNPRHTQVNEGTVMCREAGADMILAVGGGSVIDCAKAIAVAARCGIDNIWDVIERKESADRALPLAAVVTTTATGSEMNCGSVISNIEKKEKRSFGGEFIRPVAAFMNPRYTLSLPSYQTACGSADIIGHILDSGYFASVRQMDMLYSLQESVISTVVSHSLAALAAPSDIRARENLMWASAWALNGFLSENLNVDPVCHIIGHELSAMYDITHGHSIAVVCARWLRYIISTDTAGRIYRLGVNSFGIEKTAHDINGAHKTVDFIEKLYFEKYALEPHLERFGLNEKDATTIADRIIARCGGKLNSIIPMERSSVEAILKACI